MLFKKNVLSALYFIVSFYRAEYFQLPFSEDDAEEMRIRTKLVDSLKTALRTQPHSFVQRFIELDGLPSLLGALGSMDEMTAHCGLHNAYIGCVKALMNNSVSHRRRLGPLFFVVFSFKTLFADSRRCLMHADGTSSCIGPSVFHKNHLAKLIGR